MKITGIGIAVSSGEEAIPWPLRDSVVSRRYRPAASLAEMVHHALTECGARGPIVLASCNGKVTTWDDDDWRASFELADIIDEQAAKVGDARVLCRAVASAQCASGMHALYLARALLDAGEPHVTVLAVDIASAPAHDNFESLRVLTDDPAPYTDRSAGFQLGEGTVALRLSRKAFGGVGFVGPVLGHDLTDDDAIERCLANLIARAELTDTSHLQGNSDPVPQLVVGQGAGPVDADRAELAAIGKHVPAEVPVATALANAGHTLGASSLLSVAVAAASCTFAADHFTHDHARRLLSRRSGGISTESHVDIDGHGLAASQALDLRAQAPTALDGRPLEGLPQRMWRAAAIVRALGGGCGAVMVGDVVDEPGGRVEPTWGPRSAPPALRDEALRRIAAEVDANRPEHPPDIVVVTLECPLPPAARIGQRILPTSVLEMTPGFIPQLVARAWGFRGPALCLVGADPEPLLAALRKTHERVYRLAIRGMHERDVEWIPRG
ncbi:MAG TPA: hypothetical protein VL326_26790 [Kofleriaceae bacterium]|nr:hypothetical protein [Kofleriaceae bacterium]